MHESTKREEGDGGPARSGWTHGHDALLGWMSHPSEDDETAVDPSLELDRRLALRLVGAGRNSFRGQLFVALLVGLVCWGALPALPLIAWVAAIVVAAWVRGTYPSRILAAGVDATELRRSLFWTMVASALVWAAGLVTLVHGLDVPRLVLVVAILSALVTGSAVTTSSYPRAFYAFAGIIFGALLVTVLLEGTSVIHWLVVVFILGDLWWVDLVMRGTHATIRMEIASAIEVETKEEEARRERMFLTALLQSISDAVAVVRDGDEILGVNRGFERMFGWRAEEVYGRNIVDLLVPDEERGEIRNVTAGVVRGEHQERTAQRIARDGQRLWTRISVSPMRSTERRQAVVVYTDITAAKEVEEELERAKELAESANRAKSEFLATMSHEIRTPMNAIIGMAELLAEEDLTPAQRDYVEVFRTAGDALLTLINQVLDLAKIESGHMELDKRDFDLWDLIEKTARVFAVPAHQKGIELAVYIEEGVEHWVRGDPDRLSQVLANLLGNAVKFTDGGEIVLAARPDTSRASNGRIAIRMEVRDTGTGIPEDRKEAIFERFAQADSSTTRRFGGSGLGLTISQSIARMMGGSLEVESEVGVGSTFGFTALLEPGTAEAATAPHERARDIHDLRVLVVDDNSTNRLVLMEILMAWGASATEVASGADALEELKRARDRGHPYELVLLDGQMPEIDGFGVAERIQREPSLSGPTLMMLTSGESHTSDVRRSRDLGLKAYLLKPVRRAELLATILNVLSDEAEADGAGDAAEVDEGARILLVEDTAENRMLVERYLAKSPHTLRAVESGEEAVSTYGEDPSAFDVVFMDISMPGIDGYEATRRIRALEREAGCDPVPIVALTAHALDAEQRKSEEAGCDAHLTKPIKKKRLLEAIEEFARSSSPASRSASPGRAAPEGGEPLAETSGSSAARILVVEDDPVGGVLIQRYLQSGGHQVELVRDGAEALGQMGSGSFDLVLSDINMPNLDGLELVEIMREKGFDMPVALLTGDSAEDTEAQGLELGVEDFLTKPIKKDALLQRVGRILDRRKRQHR